MGGGPPSLSGSRSSWDRVPVARRGVRRTEVTPERGSARRVFDVARRRTRRRSVARLVNFPRRALQADDYVRRGFPASAGDRLPEGKPKPYIASAGTPRRSLRRRRAGAFFVRGFAKRKEREPRVGHTPTSTERGGTTFRARVSPKSGGSGVVERVALYTTTSRSAARATTVVVE